MSRFYSYINTAKKLIETYKGEKPFANFLKNYFVLNKKYGSKDRRQISALCYNYFRLGFSGKDLQPEQKMLAAFFICETAPAELLEALKPEWNKKISWPIAKKITALDHKFLPEDIFPFSNELSNGIEPAEFCRSFLVQPDLFIRIRPQTSITALKKLEKLKLPYTLIGTDCVQFTNSDRVEDFFILDKEVVIQDYNSQRVLNYLKEEGLQIHLKRSKEKLDLCVWDCCAASGGKSILLHDIINQKTDITVSDIRARVVLNLHRRFKKAGIKEYKYFIADITQAEFKPGRLDFNLIICDAPCTGSGTWSRTPEQLCFFKPSAIKEYNRLQKKIIANVLPHLQKEGLFFYITCSVFKMENEQIADYIAENFNCKLLHLQLLKGYDKKADNMFVAVFRKL